jgi:hypothetical protein
MTQSPIEFDPTVEICKHCGSTDIQVDMVGEEMLEWCGFCGRDLTEYNDMFEYKTEYLKEGDDTAKTDTRKSTRHKATRKH